MKFISKGAFHIHTTYSDGTGTISQIAKDAKKAGLDWIIITDHNNLTGLHNNEEGWYDGLAVIIGEEISPDSSDHYLALNIKEEVCCSLTPQKTIESVKSQGGIGFIAHPDESINRKNKFPPLRWTNWDIRGFNGIEIWNYMSDWGDNFDERLSYYNLLTRHYRLTGPTKNTLRWWDEVNNETSEIISAVGSLDSHAFKHQFFEIFPYLDTFKTITNYLFLDQNLSTNFEDAKTQILTALKNGNNIIVNRFWNNKQDDFIFSIISKNKEIFPGQETILNENSKLLIKLPQKAKIKLFRNGNIIFEENTTNIKVKDLSPGKYRFEAYLNNKPWIFSNPISCK
ncbi:MAG: PHP domain-containing protein [bacterium]